MGFDKLESEQALLPDDHAVEARPAIGLRAYIPTGVRRDRAAPDELLLCMVGGRPLKLTLAGRLPGAGVAEQRC